jgi:hypothetical protein
VPDVSANADINTGYAIAYHGAWFVFGGTSAAAPTWAAVMALGDGTSACRSHPIGFANGALYAAARSAYAADFNDITSGDNSFGGVTGFSAGPGYDMVSGLGSPRASALLGALCGFNAPAIAAATVRITLPATRTLRVGRPLLLALHAHDSAGHAVAFSATGLPAGLSISPAGVISGTAQHPGRFPVTVGATDGAGGSATAGLVLTVIGRPSVSHRLARTAGGRRQLVIRVVAGDFSTGIRRIAVAAAPGLVRFSAQRAALRGSVIALDARGRRLRVTVSVHGNTLVAALRGPAVRRITLRILAPALTVGAPGRASVAAVRGSGSGSGLTITAT